MTIETNNSDLRVVLKKRRKSVSDYLRQQGVDSKKKFDLLLKTLESKYSFSEQFNKEAMAYLESLSVLTKKVEEMTPKTKVEVENSVPVAQKSFDQKDETETENITRRKPKRSKRSASKSDSSFDDNE